ncbi:MAG TPA: hypothetical protein VM536_06765, partial [Chloroflexia bacterium]|nr:hypothetical protein [Chloroflexia bacterium]
MTGSTQADQVSARAAHGLPYYAGLAGYGSILATIAVVWLVAMTQVGYAWTLPNLDFMGSYLGAQLWISGQGAHLYDLSIQRQLHEQLTAPNTPVVWLLFIYPAWDALV